MMEQDAEAQRLQADWEDLGPMEADCLFVAGHLALLNMLATSGMTEMEAAAVEFSCITLAKVLQSMPSSTLAEWRQGLVRVLVENAALVKAEDA